MTAILKHEKLGSNGSLLVQLYDAETDLPINVTGVTAISAKAINSTDSSEVNFTSVIINDGLNGIFKLFRNTTSFTVADVYDIIITYTSTSGEVEKYPKEEGGLKLKIS